MKKWYELTILTEKKQEILVKSMLDGFNIHGYKFKDAGVKTLAYPIDGIEKAHYYFADWFELTPSQYRELNNHLMTRNWILRYLLVEVNRRPQ